MTIFLALFFIYTINSIIDKNVLKGIPFRTFMIKKISNFGNSESYKPTTLVVGIWRAKKEKVGLYNPTAAQSR